MEIYKNETLQNILKTDITLFQDIHFIDIQFPENYCGFNLIFKNCIFTNCELDHTVLKGCEFTECKFNHSDFFETIFLECHFSDCEFNNSLFLAEIFRCDFHRCNFIHMTNMDNTNFSHCVFINITWENLNINYSEHSIHFNNCHFCADKKEDLPVAVLPFSSYRLPEGDFIAWKKGANDNIIKLKIPEDAKRLCCFSSKKCRCNKAEVLAIYNINGNPITQTQSSYDPTFIYKVGDTVYPRKPFNDNPFEECASGIHFFIDKHDAEDYGR